MKICLQRSLQPEECRGFQFQDHHKQLLVSDSIAHQLSNGERNIVGVMVESNLHEGRQDIGNDPGKLTYGQSITDACIGWEDTELVLAQLNEGVKARRAG